MSSELKLKKKIQSSIPELSVGDERKCFNQIRKASSYIKPESLLWNGWPAGQFALSYVIGHHTKRKRKQEERLVDEAPKRKKKKVFDIAEVQEEVTEKEHKTPIKTSVKSKAKDTKPMENTEDLKNTEDKRVKEESSSPVKAKAKTKSSKDKESVPAKSTKKTTPKEKNDETDPTVVPEKVEKARPKSKASKKVT